MIGQRGSSPLSVAHCHTRQYRHSQGRGLRKVYATVYRYIDNSMFGGDLIIICRRSRSKLMTGADDVAKLLDVRESGVPE
jgi:hypothetical protein